MNIAYEDLHKWIDCHIISRPIRNINRDFADAVPLAQILKHHYPKLVELHNYSPRNSLSNKLINWEFINRKVLNKINIKLTKKERQDLAKGKPGAMERLLSIIKSKVENKNISGEQENDDKEDCIEETTNFSENVVPAKINNGVKVIDRKLVPVDGFEKLQKEIEEKRETINMLTNKVDHLEELIVVKEETIKDLTKQIQSIGNNSEEPSSNLESAM